MHITGTLNSTANTTYRVEFFANTALDSSGFGEGQSFLGFTNVTTDSNCNATFDVNFSSISGAGHVTATATDPMGNTSEFSAAIGQLLNISTRLRVQTGENVLIGGFIIAGTEPEAGITARHWTITIQIVSRTFWPIRHWNCTVRPDLLR